MIPILWNYYNNSIKYVKCIWPMVTDSIIIIDFQLSATAHTSQSLYCDQVLLFTSTLSVLVCGSMEVSVTPNPSVSPV